MTDLATAAPETDADLAALIAAGADRLDVDLGRGQVERLVAYLRLIERWNATYNLTAIREARAMATHHIVDSLAILPSLRGFLPAGRRCRVLDVGSGAGLPGVVIAIAESSADVVCIDSVGKKVAFIIHVAGALALTNLSAVHSRVQAVRSPPAFDLIVSRAYASLVEFVESTRHLLAAGGWWMAMKGKLPRDDIAAVAAAGVRFRAQNVSVPGLDAERCILLGQPNSESERQL